MSSNGTIITGSLLCNNNLTVNQELVVTGQSLLSGSSILDGDVTVLGISSFLGSVKCGTSVVIGGPTTCCDWVQVMGTSSHQGAVTLGNTLSVTGESTLTGHVSCGTSVVIGGLTTCSQLSVLGTTSCQGGVSLGNTLSVSSLTSLNAGCVFNNPTSVSTGLSTTLNFYKQGVTWDYTLTAGAASTTLTFKVTRAGNIVVLTIGGWILSSVTNSYTLTGFTNVMSGYPYGTLQGGLYQTVICTSDGIQTLVVTELTTENTLNIYPAANLAGNFSKTVKMPQII